MYEIVGYLWWSNIEFFGWFFSCCYFVYDYLLFSVEVGLEVCMEMRGGGGYELEWVKKVNLVVWYMWVVRSVIYEDFVFVVMMFVCIVCLFVWFVDFALVYSWV